jgi:hypothetical protein
MARGGARVGAGKKKGQLDRATLEAELAAAQQQLVEMSKRRQAGRKLAIDVLDDVMHMALGLASRHQPLSSGEVATPGRREPDNEKFDRYLDLTVDAAGKLANFQSPKFRSTTLTVETPNGMPADGPGMVAGARRMSGQEAYRMLRDSSELIELNPVSNVAKPTVVPSKPKKAARG